MGLVDKAKEVAEEMENDVIERKRKKIEGETSSNIEELEPDESVQAYEYNILEIGSEGPLGLSKTSEQPEQELNMFGIEGWELVEQINMENGATQALIFKRPISDERKEEVEERLWEEYLEG